VRLCQSGPPHEGSGPQGERPLLDGREARRRQHLYRDVLDDGTVLLGLGALGQPFRIGRKGVPLLLAIGQRFPGEEIGQLLVRLSDQGREEAGLLDAVLFPQLQRDGVETLVQVGQPAWDAFIDSQFMDHGGSSRIR